MQSSASHKHSGFTLVELLVSITVISILVGLFFPALNMVKQNAWNTAARDMCSQTAAGWNALFIKHRRFPSPALIQYCAKENFTSGGDIGFVMDNEATSLLNWWVPEHPLPEYDATKYKKWLENKKVKFSWDGIEEWPNDGYLERTSDQKRWGLVAPWAKRWILSATEGADIKDDKNRDILEAATVRVLLDTDGDGKITVPAELGSVALDGEGDPLVLNKTAIAWVYAGADKEKVIASW